MKKLIVALALLLLISPVSATTHIIDLDTFQKYEFPVGSEAYEIKLFSSTATVAASFSINNKADPGTAIIINMLKGEMKDLDLNKDNVKDTTLKLVSVGAGEASIEINVEDIVEEVEVTGNAVEETVEEPEPEVINEVVEETVEEPEVNEEHEVQQPVCGNNILEESETSENCCVDAGCPEGQVCISNECKQTFPETATISKEGILEKLKVSKNTTLLAIAFAVIFFVIVAMLMLHGQKKAEKTHKKHAGKIKEFLEKRKHHKPLHLKKKLLEEGLSKRAVEEAFEETGLKVPKLKITELKGKKRKQLEFYIRQRLSYGSSQSEIANTLAGVGWDKQVIKKLIKDVEKDLD
jgi:hypothetical protein